MRNIKRPVDTPRPYFEIKNAKKESYVNVKALVGLLLTLLCPPLGILYFWKSDALWGSSRIFITILGIAEMAILLSTILPEATLEIELPSASIPDYVTKAPDEDVVNALSNLQDLLADSYATPAPTEMSEEAKAALAAQRAQEEEEYEVMMNTIVYSVYNGAKYYHSVPDCDGQKNNKELTVREALAAKLAACSKCSPPHP